MNKRNIIFPNILNNRKLNYKDVNIKYYHVNTKDINRNILMLEQLEDKRQNVDRLTTILKGNIIFIGYLDNKDYIKLSEFLNYNYIDSYDYNNDIEPLDLTTVIENIEQENNVSKIWFSKYLLSNDEIDKVVNIYNSYISLENKDNLNSDVLIEKIKSRYKDIEKFKNEETILFSEDPINNEEFGQIEKMIINEIKRNMRVKPSADYLINSTDIRM